MEDKGVEEFKNCKKCGALCSATYQFCPNCGASLGADKCPNCGTELLDGAKFCVNCGMQIGDEPATKATAHIAKPTAENVSSRPVHWEENIDDVISSELEERPVSAKSEFAGRPASARSESESAKTPHAAKSPKMNYIVRIIKNASVFVLCAILFALSFCGIIKIDVDDYFYGVEECEVSISAVDVIDMMFATANVGNEDKYTDEYEELSERLRESMERDYNSRLDKYVLSTKSKNLLHDLSICMQKMMLSSEEAVGSAMFNNVIISGVFCLLNILFTAAMFIVSIISLLLVVLRKKNKVAKFLYALPAYLFISLMILFIVKTTMGAGTAVAGAMIAALFFDVMAIIAAVALIFSAKKKKVIHNAIPKLVSLAMSIIVCACLFAPVFTANYDLILENKTRRNIYSVSTDASGLLTYLPQSELEELEDMDPMADDDVYETYMKRIESYLDSLSYLTSYEFNQAGTVTNLALMKMIIYAAGSYGATGAISIGYYVLLLVFMFFGAFAVWSVASLFKKGNNMNTLLIPVLALLIAALACSVGLICVMNYHLDGLDCSFTVGGGFIAAIILTILMFVFTAVYRAVTNKDRVPREKKPRPQVSYDVADFEVEDID